MSSRGCMKAKMGTEYIHFHKANDDRNMGCFSKCGGGEGGKGDAVVGKGGQEVWRFRLAQSNQMPIFTQGVLASSLQLYLLVAERSSIVFCTSYILCGRC